MKTISIALKDLQILFKDRGTLFQLFILPLLFILVFSGALGAIGKSAEVILAQPRGRGPGWRHSCTRPGKQA